MRIWSEQEAYDLGYANPSAMPKDFKWGHIVAVNAFRCGQLDYQSHAPKNKVYSREAYDPETFERISGAV